MQPAPSYGQAIILSDKEEDMAQKAAECEQKGGY